MIKQRRTWWFPGDTELDTARHVARLYRQALARTDPAQCAELDEQCQHHGQNWVVPQIASVDLDGHLNAADLAEFLGIKVDLVYQWASRGHITRYRERGGRIVYSVREALDHQADLRRARADRQSRRSPA